MDLVIKGEGKNKNNKKKGLIIKTWERCKSFGGGRKIKERQLTHSKSWPRTAEDEDDAKNQGRRIAPEGCFSVYVGPKKQRFVIRTQCLNHPLFKVLLEEAESEYGYNYSEGPLELPCEVENFIKVLIEMDDSDDVIPSSRCSFGKSYSSYHLLTTSPKITNFLK